MYVSIGGPIFLIAVGAILRYATDFDVASIDMDVVGLILMIAGIAALILSIGLALFNRDDQKATAYDQGRADQSRRNPPR